MMETNKLTIWASISLQLPFFANVLNESIWLRAVFVIMLKFNVPIICESVVEYFHLSLAPHVGIKHLFDTPDSSVCRMFWGVSCGP